MFGIFSSSIAPATTSLYTLPLHDALPISPDRSIPSSSGEATACSAAMRARSTPLAVAVPIIALPCSPMIVLTSLKRSEEHTSELQSRQYLVCRLLLEKKKPRAANQLRTQQ